MRQDNEMVNITHFINSRLSEPYLTNGLLFSQYNLIIKNVFSPNHSRNFFSLLNIILLHANMTGSIMGSGITVRTLLLDYQHQLLFHFQMFELHLALGALRIGVVSLLFLCLAMVISVHNVNYFLPQWVGQFLWWYVHYADYIVFHFLASFLSWP